jgi:hypothetical protein
LPSTKRPRAVLSPRFGFNRQRTELRNVGQSDRDAFVIVVILAPRDESVEIAALSFSDDKIHLIVTPSGDEQQSTKRRVFDCLAAFRVCHLHPLISRSENDYIAQIMRAPAGCLQTGNEIPVIVRGSACVVLTGHPWA